MSEFYKLDKNKNVIPCTSGEWSEEREKMRENNSKFIGKDLINGISISTVWIGLDYGYTYGSKQNHKPLVFETMVFKDGNGLECYCDRYSTYAEALEGHIKAVKWVQNGCKKSEAENR